MTVFYLNVFGIVSTNLILRGIKFYLCRRIEVAVLFFTNQH